MCSPAGKFVGVCSLLKELEGETECEVKKKLGFLLILPCAAAAAVVVDDVDVNVVVSLM